MTKKYKDNEALRRAQKKFWRTPRGRAHQAWQSLTYRVRNDPHYAGRVEVKMTKDEFMEWATPLLERWYQVYPAISPSVDRIDPQGHYEISNIRIISHTRNTIRVYEPKVEAEELSLARYIANVPLTY